jgi:hypothetical protein
MRPRRTDANEGALAHRVAAHDFVLPFRGQNREDSGRRVGVAGVAGAGEQNLGFDRAGDFTAALEGVGGCVQLIAAENQARVAAHISLLVLPSNTSIRASLSRSVSFLARGVMLPPALDRRESSNTRRPRIHSSFAGPDEPSRANQLFPVGRRGSIS